MPSQNRQIAADTEDSASDEEEDSSAEPPTAGDPSQRALWEEGWVAALLEALREAESLEEARWYLPTFRNVPRPANAGWADAVKAVGDAVVEHPTDEGPWKGWSLLSRLILWAPTRQRGAELPPANKAEVVLRRLSRLFAGEAAALLEEAREAAREHAKQRRTSSPQDPDDPTAVAEAACRQAAAGNAGRAFRLYKSPGVAPRTKATAEVLQDRYLVAEAHEDREAAAPRPGDDRELLADTDVGPVLRRLPRGSGADVLGWRAEHLQAVLGREECVESLKGVLELVLTAQVPTAAKETLLTSRMSALRKSAGKLRPIGAPSVLRNVAERAACASSRSELAKAVGSRHYGVGRKAGLEEAINTARALAELRSRTVWGCLGCYEGVRHLVAAQGARRGGGKGGGAHGLRPVLPQQAQPVLAPKRRRGLARVRN